MAIITGAQGAGGTRGILAARRKVIMRDGLAELEPSANPLTLMLRKVAKKSVGAPKYEWLEHERFADTTQANGAQTNSDTTIDVDDGSIAGVNQLVRNQRTGEVMRVTSISSNEWTVTRSIGDTAAAAINDDDYFIVLSSAFNENSGAPDPRIQAATAAFNYTQIARSNFGASGTLIATDIYGTTKIISEQAKQRAIDHQCEIEKTLWFGERSENTSGTYALRTCGGVDEFITQTYDFSGSFSMQTAFDALEVGMRYGSEKKMLFCSRAAASNISLEALDKVRRVSSDKTFGIDIKMLESPHGDVGIIVHNLFTGGEYALRGYLLDLSGFNFVFLKGRDTQYIEGQENPGTDGQVNGYLTEFGLERREAKKHQEWTSLAV